MTVRSLRVLWESALLAVKYVLDNGSQDIPMTNAFYNTHLVGKIKNVDFLSQFVREVRANGLTIPVVGVVRSL